MKCQDYWYLALLTTCIQLSKPITSLVFLPNLLRALLLFSCTFELLALDCFNALILYWIFRWSKTWDNTSIFTRHLAFSFDLHELIQLRASVPPYWLAPIDIVHSSPLQIFLAWCSKSHELKRNTVVTVHNYCTHSR